MDWTITEVEKNGDYITLTGTAEIPLKELQAVLEGTPTTTSSKVVKKPVVKKVQVKAKTSAYPSNSAEYKHQAYLKKKAKKLAGKAPTVELTGDDPSQDKMERMQKLQDKLDRLEANEYANPERP